MDGWIVYISIYTCVCMLVSFYSQSCVCMYVYLYVCIVAWEVIGNKSVIEDKVPSGCTHLPGVQNIWQSMSNPNQWVLLNDNTHYCPVHLHQASSTKSKFQAQAQLMLQNMTGWRTSLSSSHSWDPETHNAQNVNLLEVFHRKESRQAEISLSLCLLIFLFLSLSCLEPIFDFPFHPLNYVFPWKWPSNG